MKAARSNGGRAGNGYTKSGMINSVAATQSQPRVVFTNTVTAPSVLLEKLRTIFSEVTICLKDKNAPSSADDFINVVEDGLRALKVAKAAKCERVQREAEADTSNAKCPKPERSGTDEQEKPEREISGWLRAVKQSLVKNKKISPKPIADEEQQREEILAARHASALRSEERQRIAEEKRLEKIQEMKLKLEAAEERGALAKERRRQAEERLRIDTMERLESGARRVEEAREQTKERARRGISRVEEVRLNNELRHQAKVLLLDRKMSEVEHNQEQKREELQRLAQERNEAILAAAERRRSLGQERMERQRQREQQRRENLRRLEEQKKLEKDMKGQRAEEWEKKVQQRQRAASAEAEARSRKAEERIQQSAQLREEKITKLRQKLEEQEQKIKEARQRKEREPDTKLTIAELMPTIPREEGEEMEQKFLKVLSMITRQGRSFIDKYQRESLIDQKDLNRSKLKLTISRLGSGISPAPVTQVRQSLREILEAPDLGDTDHEYMRYFNAYENIIGVILESRRTNNMSVLRLAHEALLRFLADKNEGRKHIVSFVRSGNLAPLLQCISEEIKGLKRQSRSVPLDAMLEALHLCFEGVTSAVQADTSLSSVRELLLSSFDSTNIEKYCIAVVKVCSDEEDLDVAHSATRILSSKISILNRRKGGCPIALVQEAASSFFALLQNILTPNGCSLSELSPVLSARRVTVVCVAFNALNCLARWNLETLQELLHDSPTNKRTGAHSGSNTIPTESSNTFTRTELFHMLNGFFTYVQSHTDSLEAIKEENPARGAVGGSFEEALKFGVSAEQMPLLARTEAISCATSGKVSVTNRQQNNLRGALHECLLLIGYLSIQDPEIQDIFAWGKGKSLLSKILSTMPFQYFTTGRHIFYPTLLTILVDSGDNVTLAKEEMDTRSLLEFIREEYQSLPKKSKLHALQRYNELRSEALANKERAATEAAKNAQPTSWADLLGGDDDEFLILAQKQMELKPLETKPVETRHPLWTPEKERFAKALKNQALTPSGYFKIEKRLPITLWPTVIDQLAVVAGEEREGLIDSAV
ncbi:hypothetical protein, conserved [Trypanosoma brucei brucei TREU927]|uniref:Uncharacterized protein n=1 Tax=Trypanosoma brucei brucei (strain 927/4 GUTat10.1) TaxID=185431 RepID=Q38E96_TRYB2|nr:hypothetical protein, conserved [Trypanosoma brucei brucei TREU927]EAN76874.1 hypothetical protein, conserved [Trypanosoma brucei brucei TREU927]